MPMQNLPKHHQYLLLCLVAFGCNTPKNIDPVKESYYGKEFFPLKEGYSWTYRVDSSAYNKLADDTISNTFIERIAIDSIYYKNQTDTTYLYEVYTSSDTLRRPLKRTHVYQVTVKPLKVLVVEENFPLVKLVIPFFNNQRWEGNEFNNLNGQRPYFNVVLNDNRTVATVTEQGDSSCLGVADVRSQYEKNIGLTHYNRRIVEYVQDPLNPCAVPLVVNNKRQLNMTLLYTRK